MKKRRRPPPPRTSVLNLHTAEFGPAFLEECLARIRHRQAEEDHYGKSGVYGDTVEKEILDCLHHAKRAGEREEASKIHHRYQTDVRGLVGLQHLRWAIANLLDGMLNGSISIPSVMAQVLSAEAQLRSALGIAAPSPAEILRQPPGKP